MRDTRSIQQAWGPCGRKVRWLTLLPALLCGEALAHAEPGLAGGFGSGFMHPILGADHLVAMVAVGLWGAQLGRPAIWILPITFPSVMALGALLGILGVPLPWPETGVALSAVALGVLVATGTRLPFPAAAVLVGLFAVFHGYAHGLELPEAVHALAYGVGFVTCTGLLHLLGISIGALMRWPSGSRIVRLCGVVVTVVGLYFLAGQAGLVP